MRQTNTRWKSRVTEWQLRLGRKGQNRRKTKWRDELRSLAGIAWNRQAIDTDE